MALTKKIVVDSTNVTEDGHIEVRTRTDVLEDGVRLSHSFHRHVLAPGDDITGLNVTVNYATLNAAGEQVTRSRETKDMYESLSGTQKTALQGIYVTLSTAVKAEYE